MARKRPPGLFITGTNTGVGKTYVAAAIARSLTAHGVHVGVYKPALSGCATAAPSEDSADDDAELWRAAGRPGELSRVAPQRFRAPLAPHSAARREGRAVDAALLRTGLEYWQSRSDFLIVEGAGGLFSPTSDADYVADLAHDLGYPLVLVAANRLGAIHETMATLFAARAHRGGLAVAAVVLNEPSFDAADEARQENFAEIARRCRPIPMYSLSSGGDFGNSAVDWRSFAARE